MSHCPNTLRLRTSYFVCFVYMCTHVCLCTMHSSFCAASMDKTFSFCALVIRHQFTFQLLIYYSMRYSYSVTEMSMAAVSFSNNHRGGGSILKKHKPEHKCTVRRCNTLRLDESYRLVTTVLVQNSHSRKIQNILLSTIAVQQRQVFSRNEHLR